jgi:hypothetical protein
MIRKKAGDWRLATGDWQLATGNLPYLHPQKTAAQVK